MALKADCEKVLSIIRQSIHYEFKELPQTVSEAVSGTKLILFIDRCLFNLSVLLKNELKFDSILKYCLMNTCLAVYVRIQYDSLTSSPDQSRI